MNKVKHLRKCVQAQTTDTYGLLSKFTLGKYSLVDEILDVQL